jgi:hypothetical protein
LKRPDKRSKQKGNNINTFVYIAQKNASDVENPGSGLAGIFDVHFL